MSGCGMVGIGSFGLTYSLPPGKGVCDIVAGDTLEVDGEAFCVVYYSILNKSTISRISKEKPACSLYDCYISDTIGRSRFVACLTKLPSSRKDPLQTRQK